MKTGQRHTRRHWRYPVWIAALLAIALGSLACTQETEKADLLVRADRVFTGEHVISGGAVAIRGSKIIAVGAESEVDVQSETTLELGAATVLPGLIDLHVHGALEFRTSMLNTGLTTVRDLGSETALVDDLPDLSGPPRIIWAGPIITAANGYPVNFQPQWGLAVRGVAAGRQVVRRVKAGGASVIKLAVESGRRRRLPVLTQAEIRAMVDEAHRLELPVTVHVTSPDDARSAIAAGADELAHMPCTRRDDDLMKNLANRDVEVVGTLNVLNEIGCRFGLENARTFVREGGMLLYGSDSPMTKELDVAELKRMRLADLTPRDVIRSATVLAGRQLGLSPLGTLREGAPADLIAVNGDPLQDLDRLRHVTHVIANGTLIVADGRPAT
ncbi:MAG: amidohydrolase family protein [Chloroflexota bacterium]|nr:amidohydrolase family protein [Chloroflexota bacterium]